MWNAASRQFFLNQAKPYPYATGGNYVYLYEDTATGKTYRVHEFLTTGITANLDVEVGGDMEYLVVAGGGGGGAGLDGGGGGGAGGMTFGVVNFNKNDSVEVYVGFGGLGVVCPYDANSLDGKPSKLLKNSSVVAETSGGGGGGFITACTVNGSTVYYTSNGRNGGSGGGGRVYARLPGTGIAGQGNGGGTGNSSAYPWGAGGGGGGAGEVGESPGPSGPGGDGGDGLEWPAGSERYFAGGGGGRNHVNSGLGIGGSGGLGGGGNAQQNGTANTGGGGGGGADNSTNGGSGIVIVRYVVAEKKLWTPSELSDLSVWLDANDTSFSNNDAVSTWTNKGSGNDTTQSDSSKRPIFKTNLLNGKPGVQFDGSNDCLQITSLPLNTYISVFVVAKTTTSNPFFVEHSVNAVTNNNGFWFYGKGGVNNAFYRVERNGLENAYLGVTDWFGSNAAQASLIINSIPSSGSPMGVVYKNGTSQDSSTPAGATTYDAISNSSYTDTLNIGARNNGASVPTDGDWHELIIYNTALSTADRQKMEGYLAHKWGLTNKLPSGHPYKYEPPYKVEPEEIVTDGLVLNLDAGDYASYPKSGTTWYDITGNGYNGTLTNGPTYNSANKGSIVFDGINDYVMVGNIGSFTSMSICTFMKRDGNQVNYAGLVFSRGTFANGLNYRETTNQLGYHWNNSPNTYGWVSGLVPPDGEWIMAALCVSGSVATMYMCSSSGITSASKTHTHTSATFEALKIALDQGSRYSKGNIATVHIYNRALSSTEVQQNFNALRGRYGI